MNGTRAYCPQCKNEVEFQRTGTVSQCPVCGFQYPLGAASPGDVVTTSPRRKALTPAQHILVIGWMVLPAIFVLFAARFTHVNPVVNWFMNLPLARMFWGAINPFVSGLVLGGANSLAVAYWLARRLSPNVTSRVILTFFLALGVVFLNVAVFFVGCLALAR